MKTLEKPSGFDACVAFLIEDCLARGQANRTAEIKRYLLDKFVTWCRLQGVTNEHEVDRDVLEQYRRYLSKYRKRRDGEPLSLSTQRMRLMAVTGLLKCLHYYEVINSNFYKNFKLPRVPAKLPKHIPEFDAIELLMHQPLTRGTIGIRDRAILEVFYATGMRRCEIANLNLKDIDFKNKVIVICKGKGSLDRVVPIADRALHWLKKYLDEIRPKLSRLKSGDAVFLGRTGKRIRTSVLTEMVHDYILRSGIRDHGACHILRHATATHMLRNGADIRYIQEFLGHLDLKSTQIYTHVTVNDLREVYKRTHPSEINR
jgi:integrase/recombinase XerD